MKNYYNRHGFGSLPVHLFSLLGWLIVIPIIYIFHIRNMFVIFLLIGLYDSFVSLDFSGKYLDKHCTNKDLEKCQKCKNWNCTRERSDK